MRDMDDAIRKRESARFMETWHRIDSLYNLYARSLGLSLSATLVLECLYYPGDVYTQKGLSEKFGLPKQAVNSIIKSFWEQGYVELKEAKDRRNKEIFLTDKGRVHAREITGQFEAMEAKVWERFTIEEMTIFADFMEIFEKSLEEVTAQSN